MCEVLSRESGFTDWRPNAHHRQYESDTFFDSRLNAFLRCEQVVMNSYYEKVCRNSAVRDISTTIKVSLDNIPYVVANCIISGLSDPDRNSFIDGVTSDIQRNMASVIILEPCRTFNSSSEFFDQIIDNFRYLLYQHALSDKRDTCQPLHLLRNTNPQELSKDPHINSLQSLEKLFQHYQLVCNSECKFVTILFRFVEIIDGVIIGDIISRLYSGQSYLRFHLVFFHSAVRPMIFHISTAFQSHARLSLINTPSAYELYDDVVGNILSARDVPVALPVEAIAWIHEAFWKSEHCVLSAVRRILLCLGQHFTERASLLCMFQDTTWLYEMGIVKKPATSKKDSDEREKELQWEKNADLLLTCLSARDFADTEGLQPLLSSDMLKIFATHNGSNSIRPSAAWKGVDAMTAQAVNSALVTSHKLGRFRFGLLSVFVIIRDCLLPARKTEFAVDIIYAAILATKGSKCNLLADLFHVAVDSLKSRPLYDIRITIERMVTAFKWLSVHMDPCKEENTIRKDRNNFSSVSDDSKLFQECKLIEVILAELEMCSMVFDELSAQLSSLCAQPQIVSLSKLRKGQYTLKSQDRRNEADSIITSINDLAHTNCSTTAGSNSNGPHCSDNEIKQSTINGVARLEDMELTLLAENIIDDVANCFSNFIRGFVNLPSRPAMAGVLTISERATKRAVESSQGNLRFRISECLLNPEKSLPNTVTQQPSFRSSSLKRNKNGASIVSSSLLNLECKAFIPDQCVLAEKASTCCGTEHVYDWFDYFIARQDPWPICGKPLKKTKRARTRQFQLDDLPTSNQGGDGDNNDFEPGGHAVELPSTRKQMNVGEFSEQLKSLCSTALSTSTPASEQEVELPEYSLSDADMLQMRCRFAVAMNDLHSLGLIKMKMSGSAVSRNTFSWMVDKTQDH